MNILDRLCPPNPPSPGIYVAPGRDAVAVVRPLGRVEAYMDGKAVSTTIYNIPELPWQRLTLEIS